MSRPMLLGMFALLAFSCQRFKDRFDAVGTLCGLDPAHIQADDLYIKLESPEGEELAATTLLSMRSRLLLAARRSENLSLTSRGCVHIQDRSGVLQAFSTAQAWSLAKPLAQVQDRGLVRLRLQPSSRVSAELQCPTAGFFAHQELPFPLRWTSDGTLQATRFELMAWDETLQKNFVLFEKPYGQDLMDLPPNIRTEMLPEGQYQLRLTFQTSTEAWDLPGAVVNRSESCALTVLHRPPEVGGLDGYSLDQRVAVFAKGEVLPWKTPSAASELHVCREKLGQDWDDSGIAIPETSCRPRSSCQDLKNFQKETAIIARDAGVFDYYAYAEDKAGNRSTLKCQTLVVSDRKPELELQWSEESWNKPAAQMQVPRAQVGLRIRGRHPQLEDSSLATRYQCRADFVREDQSILSGRAVICTSGRCRQQSLENFVPCDADVQLSIADLWPLMKAEGGTLRVFVKADDRAGHSEEGMATIGIQPQRWKPARRTVTQELADSTNQLLQDRQGRIYAVSYNQIKQRNESLERWDSLPAPAAVNANSGSITKVWFSQEGELHAEWQLLDRELLRYYYLIARRTEAGWQELPALNAEKTADCRQAQPFHTGGFFCSTAEGLALYQGSGWTRLAYPQSDREACTALPQTQFLVQDQAKTFWLACNHEIFQKRDAESSWTRTEDPRPLVKMVADAQHRIWTLRGTGRDDLTLLLTEAGRTRAVPPPASFNAMDLRREDFVIGPASEIILGDSYWDEATGGWQVFLYLAQRQRGPRLSPKFLARGELIWATEQGLWQWDGEGLRNWNLAVHDLKSQSTTVAAVMGRDGVPWVLASPGGSYEFPYQFQLKSWVHFPKPNLIPGSVIAGLWVDAASTTRIYIPQDGLYTLESGGWTRSLRSPGLRDESPVESSVFEPTLLSSDGIYRWLPEKDWTRVIRFPQPRTYWGGARDGQGRLWMYQDGPELGVIDGLNFFPVTLGEAGMEVKGIFERRADVVIATEKGLWTPGADAGNGVLVRWQDFGLEGIDRIRQIDADTYFVSVTDEWSAIKEFWMLDLKHKSKKSFAVPEQAFFLGNIKKTSRGDYILSIKFDIFRTDGVTFTKIFSERDLRSLVTTSGTFLNIWRLQLDASDRVWFDTGYGVVRIDLP